MILLISVWSLARPALPLDGPANRWTRESVVVISTLSLIIHNHTVSCRFHGRRFENPKVVNQTKVGSRNQIGNKATPLTLTLLDLLSTTTI